MSTVDINRDHFHGKKRLTGEEDLDLAALLQCLQEQISTSTQDNLVTLQADEVLSPGQPVYVTNVASWRRAQGDAEPQAVCAGIVKLGAAVGFAATVQVVGPITFPVATWALITGEPGGLTPGAAYWLDPSSPAMLTKNYPTSGYQTQVGVAKTNETFTIKLWEPIRL